MQFILYADKECNDIWQVITAPELDEYDSLGSDAYKCKIWKKGEDNEPTEMGEVFGAAMISFGATPPVNEGTRFRLPELQTVHHGEVGDPTYLYTSGGTKLAVYYYREEDEPDVHYFKIEPFKIYTDIENDEDLLISDHYQTVRVEPAYYAYRNFIAPDDTNVNASVVLDYRETIDGNPNSNRIYDFGVCFQTAPVHFYGIYTGMEVDEVATGLFGLVAVKYLDKTPLVPILKWKIQTAKPSVYTANILNISDVTPPEGDPPENTRYSGTGSNYNPGGQGIGHGYSDPAEFPDLSARNAALSWGGNGKGLTYYKLSREALNEGVFGTVFAKITDIPDIVGANDWNRLLDIGATLALDTDEIRNCLLSAFVIPFNPTGTPCTSVAVGYINCNASGQVIGDRFTQIFDSTIDLRGQGWDDFTDFESSQITLNLPFVGNVEISPHAAIKSPVRILLIGDAYTGNLSYWVYTIPYGCTYNYRDDQWVLYGVYTGNCAAEIPIQGSANAGHLLGKIQNAGSSIATGARQVALGVVGMQSGNVQQGASTAGGVSDSLIAARNSILNTADQTYTFRGGATDTNSGGVCTYHCTMQVLRAQKLRADPDHKIESPPAAPAVHSLNFYKGFVQVKSTALNSLSCSDVEKAKIEILLKEGVYI